MLMLAILAIVAINGFAYTRLMEISQSWKISLLPGSVSDQLIQLAIILAVNCAVIFYLLVTRK